MKKQLLSIMATMLLSSTIYAQGIVTTDNDVQTIVTNSTFPGISATASVGVFSANANYNQLRGTAVILDDLAGTITFNLQTASGTIDGVPTFEFTKLGGNSASVTITIGGLTPQVFNVASDGVADSNSFVSYPLEFTETVTFSTTPTTVTFNITDVDQGSSSAVTNSRLYNVSIDKTTLSSDSIDLEDTASISQNPVENSFSIKIGGSNNQIKTLEIFNISGKLVKSFKGQASYDISELTSGLYIATAKTASKIIPIKLIKK